VTRTFPICCASAPTCDPVYLDVSDLVSADAVGIDSLRRLRESGATVLGAHGIIQLKLDLPST
jgi:hypothetical protein